MHLPPLLPAHKLDTDAASKLVALGFPAVEPVLPALLEWLQDMNWPVARVVQPFLAGIGAPLAPPIRTVFASGDSLWKYWVIQGVVGECPALARALAPELERLAYEPTPEDREEGVQELAAQVLRKVRSHNPGA